MSLRSIDVICKTWEHSACYNVEKKYLQETKRPPTNKKQQKTPVDMSACKNKMKLGNPPVYPICWLTGEDAYSGRLHKPWLQGEEPRKYFGVKGREGWKGLRTFSLVPIAWTGNCLIALLSDTMHAMACVLSIDRTSWNDDMILIWANPHDLDMSQPENMCSAGLLSLPGQLSTNVLAGKWWQ